MLKTGVRKYDVFKTYYWHDAALVGKYRLPQLKATQSIPHDVIGFNERKGVSKPQKHWIDFFIDDSLFENFWNHPEQSFNNLKKYAGIVTTDYSMLPELLPGQNIWNCTRNRVMAYYLQINNFDVVPVASWCEEDDFDWCFDGLPEQSNTPGTSYLLYRKNGDFDQLRVFGEDRIPRFDMDYGVHDGKKSLHVHYYTDGKRSKTPEILHPGDALYEKYKSLFKGVK